MLKFKKPLELTKLYFYFKLLLLVVYCETMKKHKTKVEHYVGKNTERGVNQYLQHIQNFLLFFTSKPIRYFPEEDSRIYADTLSKLAYT